VSIDTSVMVARMQALSSTVSSLGPALEAAAPSGEFQAVLDNANAALNAAADPAVADSSAATEPGGGSLLPSITTLGLSDATGTTGTTGASAGVSGSSVVADAQQYLGVPYRWGGTDPTTGLDCSGLVQRVYGDLGISLPRTSQEQVSVGTPVASLAQAQPGDLVFFEPTSSGPGHVGIYIGNGQMIDAPHTGTDVQVQAVGHPIAIRRVLPGATASASSTSGTAGSIPASLQVPGNLAPLFAAAAAQHGVPAALLAAVAKQESGYNPSAVSSAGAEGIMQLMPSTAAGLGVNALDPAQAIGAGAQLLGSYLQRYNGSVPLALAAYNAGPGAVAKYGGVPPYPQTTAYVNDIVGMLGAAS
jgi:peptidoglycan DL-endopeptidase CwlO